jgi:hypothetical protein|tara:strand:- start:487 stop:657 length:171 start_codon:yes stop_codon:yes gene_type:complete
MSLFSLEGEREEREREAKIILKKYINSNKIKVGILVNNNEIISGGVIKALTQITKI